MELKGRRILARCGGSSHQPAFLSAPPAAAATFPLHVLRPGWPQWFLGAQCPCAEMTHGPVTSRESAARGPSHTHTYKELGGGEGTGASRSRSKTPTREQVPLPSFFHRVTEGAR